MLEHHAHCFYKISHVVSFTVVRSTRPVHWYSVTTWLLPNASIADEEQWCMAVSFICLPKYQLIHQNYHYADG